MAAAGLFSDAEGGENFAQEIVGGELAEDLAEGVKGFAELEGDDFIAAGVEGGLGAVEGGEGVVDGLEVTGIEGEGGGGGCGEAEGEVGEFLAEEVEIVIRLRGDGEAVSIGTGKEVGFGVDDQIGFAGEI